MNAKKIMGAVLVALLAAALFIGAGAAAEEGDQGTYFAYQNGTTLTAGVWQNGANTVTVTEGNVSDVTVAGTYTLGKMTAYFTKPTATYSAVGKYNGKEYIVVNGGNVYAGSNLTITVIALNQTVAANQLRLESPDGSVEFVGTEFFNGDADSTVAIETAGTYKVQAVWNETSTKFVAGAPLPVVDANVFTFTVVKPEDATISGSVDNIIAGEVISITVKGTPGVAYNLTLTGINADDQKFNQIVNLKNLSNSVLNFIMPNIGEVTFQLTTAEDADEVKVELATMEKSKVVIGKVEIAVTKPVITATLGAPSYFIGDKIEVILSSTGKLGSDYTFTIDGTNIDETVLNNEEDPEKEDGKLIYKLENDSVKLDVGTYTIAVKSGTKVVATLPVALKQPFISIAEAPEVVVQNKSASFIINAEAAENGIQAYIFGTNKFIALNNGSILNEEDEEGEYIKNLFNVTLPATETKNMSTGQYFAVFQHPMYDGNFNINVTTEGVFYLNTEATACTDNNKDSYLFNAKDRQTANAAQALCDALDSQNIDDMYVKASFFVVSTVDKDTFSISEIPTTVAQGETITITGVATEYAEGTQVTVEMVSTAFAAVPKETVGSAAFILATTEIAEDGTWEITLDTTGLNIDEYNLAVKISNDLKESVTVNVVAAEDEPVDPEQPGDEPSDEPTEPVAPETPGFGALAALAGLGAVAVLLLRRE